MNISCDNNICCDYNIGCDNYKGCDYNISCDYNIGSDYNLVCHNIIGIYEDLFGGNIEKINTLAESPITPEQAEQEASPITPEQDLSNSVWPHRVPGAPSKSSAAE